VRCEELDEGLGRLGGWVCSFGMGWV
jgi:hypothetical protein